MGELAAVILVGGKSSRMGQDKATLPYKRKRLVDVVADAVHAAGVAHIYVSGEIAGYNCIPDLLAERGPVGGLCSCIVQLSDKHTRLLFIPVDMPCLTPELLQLLASQPAEQACHIEDHPLPCILPLHRNMLRHADATAQALARKNKVSVKSFLAEVSAIAIAAPDALKISLTNTNTPEEWKEVSHESTHQ